ncbi:MAG: response regulator [Chloroflexi bacterium]|nr:response regulator [Chloroflexota bacterium]
MYQRILVVEDDVRLRQVIVRNLSARGHLVREAATADDAIATILEDLPDLLLLDLNLPDRSGWDVLRELRARNVAVPTVIVSAVRAVPSRLAEFHPLAYLPKPFPIEVLLRLVRTGATAVEGDSSEAEPLTHDLTIRPHREDARNDARFAVRVTYRDVCCTFDALTVGLAGIGIWGRPVSSSRIRPAVSAKRP